MSKYRVPSKKSKYYIPKEDYLTAIHYSLRYPLLKQEVEDMANTARAITYDKEKVQTSTDYDSTYEAAVRIQDKQKKIQLIDDTIEMVAGDELAIYLRKGVCHGFNYNQLKSAGMPCGESYYYDMRRHYYYELIKKI